MIKPLRKQSETSLFFVSYIVFFLNVIYLENVIHIHKSENFEHNENLQKLASLVSFPFYLFMK